MRSSVFLAQAKQSPRRVGARLKPTGEAVTWLYLGRNQVRLREWEKELGEGFRRVNFAADFQATAFRLREAFLDWVAEMSQKHQSLVWWSSRLAEKNILLDTVHHTICYLEIARRYLAGDTPLLLVCESEALVTLLRREPALGGRLGGVFLRPTFLSRLHWSLFFVLKWIWFWGDAAFATLDARLSRWGLPESERTLRQDGRPTVLIHSFMDDSFFKVGQDRYFNELPAELERRGYRVLLLPRLFNVTRSRRSAFRWFRRRPGRFLIPEDYYRLADYLWSMRILVRQLWEPRGPHRFQGTDISELVKEVQRRQCVMIRSANYIRYYRLVQRLSERGIPIDIFIDTFENMFNEKPSVMAFRQFMPRTLTVGYQHWASPGPLNFGNFTTVAESAIAPHPDVIVCCSPFTKKIFSEGGYPSDRLRVGPSLRYPHLQRPAHRQSVGEKNVLALFCLEPNAISHLLHTLLDAFSEDTSEFTLWLKPHPLMDLKKWERMFEGRPPLSNMVRVGGSMADWIPRASCAIVGTSSTSMELVMAGVPTVQLGRENDFDLNVLHWFPQFPPPVYTAADLRQQVQDALQKSETEKNRLAEIGRELLTDCISPINDETIGAFCRGRPKDYV